MAAPSRDHSFLRAARGEAVERVPVWFMRQAGRSLPEYRALRERYSILELCQKSDLIVEVTSQPVRRLGVDAAILFSDIVLPLLAIGVELDIRHGVGPVIESPIRTASDVDRIRPLEPETDLPYVLDAVTVLSQELDVPLIGFGGAPFTLASYLVEGGPSKNHARTKALMYSEPAVWHKLMDRLAEVVGTYLQAQVRAGASAIQLFDSWVGQLDREDFRTYVAPSVQRILGSLEGTGVPRIYFGVGTGELLAEMPSLGAEVVGVDWRVPLDEARRRVGENVSLQGNLDPTVCLAPWDIVEEKARDILERTGGRKHIFNLGHGVLPETDPAILGRLVEFVHAWEPHR